MAQSALSVTDTSFMSITALANLFSPLFSLSLSHPCLSVIFVVFVFCCFLGVVFTIFVPFITVTHSHNKDTKNRQLTKIIKPFFYFVLLCFHFLQIFSHSIIAWFCRNETKSKGIQNSEKNMEFQKHSFFFTLEGFRFGGFVWEHHWQIDSLFIFFSIFSFFFLLFSSFLNSLGFHCPGNLKMFR